MELHGAIVNSIPGVDRGRPLVTMSDTAHAGAGPRPSYATLQKMKAEVASLQKTDSTLIWIVTLGVMAWIFIK